MQPWQAWLLFCVLLTVAAIMFMLVQLAARESVGNDKLAVIASFGGMAMTVIGTVAGYVVGKMDDKEKK